MFGWTFSRSTQTEGSASAAGVDSGCDARGSGAAAILCASLRAERPFVTKTSASFVAPWKLVPARSVSCHGEMRETRTARVS